MFLRGLSCDREARNANQGHPRAYRYRRSPEAKYVKPDVWIRGHLSAGGTPRRSRVRGTMRFAEELRDAQHTGGKNRRAT